TLESVALPATYNFENDRKNMPAGTTRRFLPTSLRSTNARRFRHYRFDYAGHRTGASRRCNFIAPFGWDMAPISARHSISRGSDLGLGSTGRRRQHPRKVAD